jgi:hypothetical protein
LTNQCVYRTALLRRGLVAPRGLPVVRWRSSGLRPSLATADSLPSSHGQSGGVRRPQVLRYARTCAALRSTADVPVSSWAKKRAGRTEGIARRPVAKLRATPFACHSRWSAVVARAVRRRSPPTSASLRSHLCCPSLDGGCTSIELGEEEGLVAPRCASAIVPRAGRLRGGMTAAASLLAY